MNFLRQGWLSPLFARVADAPPSVTPSPSDAELAPIVPASDGETPTDEELAAAHEFLRAPRPADARVAMLELDRVCQGQIARMDGALAKASAEYRANLLLDRILGGVA